MAARDVHPHPAADPTWVAEQRKWSRGWRRIVFPGAFLAYLIQVATVLPKDAHGAALVAGAADLVLFAVGYVLAVPATWMLGDRRYTGLVAAMAVLWLIELPFAHADAFVMGVFVVALLVIRFGERGLVAGAAVAVTAILLPPAVGPWHDTLTTGLSNGTAIAISTTALAMYGFGRVIRGSVALERARAELDRLAAENERARIARDLHDLLGHSLTTISVKAELAHKLTAHDPDAAAREIADVAALTRRALGDVRAAVASYREVTLAGELATGRELLRAAGITGELPPAVELVDDAAQELFGWVVREGLTNVVRHSRARTCRVQVSPASVEILDDGVGGRTGTGNGLAGLAERVAAAGGTLEAGPLQPTGWRLAVHLAGAGTGA